MFVSQRTERGWAPQPDLTPKFFRFCPFVTPAPRFRVDLSPRGGPVGLAGRKADRLVQPFAVRQDLERLALHRRAGKIRRKWLCWNMLGVVDRRLLVGTGLINSYRPTGAI